MTTNRKIICEYRIEWDDLYKVSSKENPNSIQFRINVNDRTIIVEINHPF